jgi:hypothetical protein
MACSCLHWWRTRPRRRRHQPPPPRCALAPVSFLLLLELGERSRCPARAAPAVADTKFSKRLTPGMPVHKRTHEQVIQRRSRTTCSARRGLVIRINHAVGGDALVHGLNDHLNSVDGLGLVQNVDVVSKITHTHTHTHTHALVAESRTGNKTHGSFKPAPSASDVTWLAQTH